jgi:hypothetical protein
MRPEICRIKQGHRSDTAKSTPQGTGKIHDIFRQRIYRSQPRNDNSFSLHVFNEKNDVVKKL